MKRSDLTGSVVSVSYTHLQALHRAGIRVIMDMVYNHTFNTVESNFERTVPGLSLIHICI